MKALLPTQLAMALLLGVVFAGAAGVNGIAATTTMGADQAPGTAAASSAGASSAAPNSAVTAPENQSASANANAAPQTAPPQTLEQMADQRITDLRQRLNISSKQEPAWNKFARVMRDNARQLDQAYQQRAQQFDSMSAVANMKSYAKIEQARARDVEKLVPAFESLYAALTPEQKQQADVLFRDRAEAAQQKRTNATANR